MWLVSNNLNHTEKVEKHPSKINFHFPNFIKKETIFQKKKKKSISFSQIPTLFIQTVFIFNSIIEKDLIQDRLYVMGLPMLHYSFCENVLLYGFYYIYKKSPWTNLFNSILCALFFYVLYKLM